MKAPRSVIHAITSPDGAVASRELLSVAVRITPVTGAKEGFFVQLFPDMRAPQSVYLTAPQLERLLAVAESGAADAEVWTELAKIPMEALAPARGLYPRLKALLVDGSPLLRDEISAQHRRAEARAKALEPVRVDPPVASEPAAAPRSLNDPDAL